MRLSFLFQALSLSTAALLLTACGSDNDSDSTPIIRDVTPPLITTDSNFADGYTAVAAVFLSGTVEDNGGVKSLSYQLNEQPAQTLTLDTDGSFDESVPLVLGSNKIVLTATDNAGNIMRTTKTVILGDEIAASGSHTGALKDGQLYSWGRNNYGQTGLGVTSKLIRSDNTINPLHPDTPKLIKNAPRDFVSIAFNQNHSLAIDKNGRVYSWGEDKSGQLGRGDLGRNNCNSTEDCRLDIDVIAGIDNAIMVAPGYSHNLVLTQNGDVWAMGTNNQGQLGSAAVTTEVDANGQSQQIPIKGSSTPIKVDFSAATDIGRIIQVVVSTSSSYALDDKGQVWGWGSDAYANLGKGQQCNTANSCVNFNATPTLINVLNNDNNAATSAETDMTEKVTQLAAGRDHVLALTNKESVYGWGLNASNQIGYTAKNPSADGLIWEDVITSPIKLPWFTDKDVRRVYANGNASYVLLEDGKAYPWGMYGETNSAGKTSYSNLNEPTDKLKNMAAIDNMAMGSLHQIAQERTGEIFTWGWSFEGSLGNKDTFNIWMYNTPIQVVIPNK